MDPESTRVRRVWWEADVCSMLVRLAVAPVLLLGLRLYAALHLMTCVCSLQDAVAIVKDIAEADKAARRLVDEAYQRGSNDNISCVVLKFRF
jgi:hypothetical protein